MNTRPTVRLVSSLLLSSTLAACGDSTMRDPTPPITGCGADHTLLELIGQSPDPEQTTRERWCAKDTYPCASATCGVADGAYEKWLGDDRVRAGAFDDGQPDGDWTDWYRPSQPDAQPVIAMTYRFDDGLADGPFVAYREDGTRLFERRYAAGRPCGTWRDYDANDTLLTELDLGPCTSGPATLPDTFGLVSPRVTDFGWDGTNCPGGQTREVTTSGDTRTTRCLPNGPFRTDRISTTVEVLEIGTLKDGLRDGPATTFHPPTPNDTAQRVATTGAFTANARSGPWHFYRADGSLERRGSYTDDLETGLWETCHPSLLRASSGYFDGGRKTGTWSSWHDLSAPTAPTLAVGGVLATDETFVDGVRHGPFVHHFPSGAKEREGTYTNGAWSGLVTTFWEHGPRRYATTYRGGMASGPHEAWDTSGRIAARGQFEFGQRVGPWLGWVDPNPLILFFGGGAVRTRTSVTFVEDQAHGPMTQHYSPEGEAIGPLAGEGQLRHGVDEGDLTLYWDNGQPLVEGTFEGGQAQGLWQSFYPSGAEWTTWPFARGQLHGPFLERHENAAKKREGTYSHERRVGLWTTFDENGAVLSTENCGPDGAACDCALAQPAQEGCR